MWINHHNDWTHVKYINKRTVHWTISVLFFSSFFPYAMSLVDVNLDNKVAQGFYGIIVLLVTFTNIMLARNLLSTNPESEYLRNESLLGKRLLLWDIAIKIIGFILTITVYPPAMLIAVIITLIFIIFPSMFLESKES